MVPYGVYCSEKWSETIRAHAHATSNSRPHGSGQLTLSTLAEEGSYGHREVAWQLLPTVFHDRTQFMQANTNRTH